ncbi:MAG: GNAT family N-acetyltransferase [Betaproteobacteria bacterium]|nr:GNAT family N-acetyltransferase [Betaproteobacteria bacterium]
MPHEAPVPSIPGLTFRESEPGDEAFLKALYRGTREPELDLTGWPEPQRQAFADQQFALQDRYYREHYREAAFLVIERAGERIGRLYLHPSQAELRVMDISLAPPHRSAGLGTAIMGAIQEEAARRGAAVTLHVEMFNRARDLYARLGFREEALDGIYYRLRWDPPVTGG